MKNPFIFFLLSTCFFQLSSQDLNYAREVLQQLSSRDFHGRGYVQKGDSLAADYLSAQFGLHGLDSFGPDYFQAYSFPINTFPGKITVKLEGKKIFPGDDYVISSANPSFKGKYPLMFLPDSVDTREKLVSYVGDNPVNAFLVTDVNKREFYGFSLPGVIGIIVRTEKMPYWHVSKSGKVGSTFWIKIRKELLTDETDNIFVKAQNDFIENYTTKNVIAYVKGKKEPDRFIVFTAHYDHLGMMGKKTYFPGANDNGSGTTLLMDLARHYAEPKHRPDYSIAFMAFSGEEAGLHGSSYYVANPLFDLRAIKLLVNLDMVGTGSDGIAIVNGEAYHGLYEKMVEINDKNGYLPAIAARGEACNSDHCPFYQTGVKSIFIYTMGEEHMEYHNVADRAEKVPFTAYKGLFRLLNDYIQYVD